MDQNFIPAVAASAGRTGQGEQIGAAGDAADSPRLDRRRADFRQGNPAKHLTEALDFFFEHRFESLGRDIAAGQPGAAGGEHHVDFGGGDPALQTRDNRRHIVAHQVAVCQLMAGGG